MNHPDLVEIDPHTDGLAIHLVYATADNLAGRVIYQDMRCLLHRDAAACLLKANQLARLAGYRVQVLDAYRPPYAQQLLWRALPNAEYVRDPALGSHHSRGVAVDVTLLDEHDTPLDMGTGFDDMRTLSHPFNPDLPAPVQRNRLVLLGIMMGAGFAPIASEWWHFELPAADRYALIDHHHLSAEQLHALLA
ncbi:D-alanyl-D-alanine dipeptidase [Pseudomonas typographi]|uniref:D-alanyl-D-alanine dipeptidase n=1 Tax=Pseudomonas typographi TaxID=2715964 RepID=A0ABR7Z7V5_9PSED|nr:D-alanyl-D-alanine dipeptidase [Pseudomonas typographi]MBD1587147.1 D-alanyl-D-alanine dipeptidase [Pseudomonas typographi]MBD1601403.1 D-alanyl-D-alanine dipeptidase [Pseudomonas typographi]